MPQKNKPGKSPELKELESMLERDVKGSQPALGRSGITRQQVTHSLTRLMISSLLLLLVYFLGLLSGPLILAAGILLLALLEVVILFSSRSGDGDTDSRQGNE